MKHFWLSLVIPLFLSCSIEEGGKEFSPRLIAHAGGAVDSCVYTNSREALLSAVEKGYEFIEFDLLFTSDSVLVAAHSWNDFNVMTDSAHWGDSVPSYDDFVSRRIYKRYTPLSAQEINSFFERHPALSLVTDKTSDPNVLQHYFPNLKERMVVEAFSFQHYCRLKSQGYSRVLYSCMADDLSATLFGSSLGEIEWIALHTSAFDNTIFKFIESIADFDIALFTVDTLESVPAEYRDRVKMVYTDYITP